MDAPLAWLMAGAAMGAVLATLMLRARAAAGAERLRAALEAQAATHAERRRLQHQVDESREEASRLRADAARLEAQLGEERRSSAEKLAVLHEAEARLREAFEGVSAQALRKNAEAFVEMARSALGQQQHAASADLEARQSAIAELVRPVGESFARLQAALQTVEKDRVGSYAALREQITQLASGQRDLRTETASLVKALRSPATRGRWGEIQLRRVCELAGMLEHCDFHEQLTAPGDEHRLRPDVQVRLPGGRTVVVDAKVPVHAYLEAVEAEDDAQRGRWLRDHARQVRDHVAQLSGKAYWDQLPHTPDFVVLFLPGEPFLSAAWEEDPALVESALGQRVMLATPVTLIALLKAVAFGWRQEALAENARTISELGRHLYGRLLTMAGHFGAVGKGLGQAVVAYNRAVGSLERRVLVAARQFEALGVSCPEPLPVLRPVDQAAREPLLAAALAQPDGD